MSNPTIDSKKFGPHNYADEGTSDCGHGCGSCHNALIGINPEAVPMMLAALNELIRAEDCGMGRREVAERIDKARAAIAKAKGK